MQRRLGVMVGAVALGFAGVLGAVPSGAAAETAGMAAQTGKFIVYEHDDFEGGSASFTSTDTDLSNNSWQGEPGRIINDNISSVKNQTDHDVILFQNKNCTGDAYLSKKHSEDKDLTNNGFDNKASCVKFS